MIYFFPFLFLVLFSFKKNTKLTSLEQFIIFIFLVIFIGLRVDVGADWIRYNQYSIEAQFMSFGQILNRFDVWGYSLILYLVGITKTGIIGLNFLMSIFFSIGIVYFCNKLENPLLALMCAYPYLIVNVSMGFITQSAALGCVLVGLILYEKKNYIGFYISLLAAFSFHTSAPALVLIPLVESIIKIRKKSSLYFLVFGLILTFYFLGSFYGNLLKSYEWFFVTEYKAGSALITSGIAFLISLIFLIKIRLFKFSKQKKDLLLTLSLNVVAIFIYTLFATSTTATYRIGLYFYPLQIYILSYLPYTKIFNLTFKEWKLIVIMYNFLLVTLPKFVIYIFLINLEIIN